MAYLMYKMKADVRPCWNKLICRRFLQLAGIITCVCIIHFSVYYHMKEEQLLSHKNVFNQEVTPEEHELMVSLIRTFDDIAQKINLTYFLVDGSLLGSVRHHDMIPWDDDIDLAILLTDKDKLFQLFDLLPENMTGVNHKIPWARWKMGFRNRPKYLMGLRPDTPWTFPFLDIDYYDMRNFTPWDVDVFDYFFGESRISPEVIFPLVRRPFMGLSLPVPRCSELFLKLYYKSDIMKNCASMGYSHKKEFHINPIFKRVINCDSLRQYYPFVHREKLKDMGGFYIVNETLFVNGTALYSTVTYY